MLYKKHKRHEAVWSTFVYRVKGSRMLIPDWCCANYGTFSRYPSWPWWTVILMVSIRNCMNTSAFRGLWARVMFWSPQNQEMYEQVYPIFCLLYSQQSYFGINYFQHFIELSVLLLFNFLVDFPLCRPILPNFQPSLCCFQNIWFLEFSFSCSTSLWFEISKRLSAILFLFSNLALEGVSITTSVLHSIT